MVTAPVIEVETVAPKVAGQSIRKIWKANITDPKAAVLAIMQWPDWEAYIRLSDTELNRFAARTKGAVKVAGVEFAEEASLSSRGL